MWLLSFRVRLLDRLLDGVLKQRKKESKEIWVLQRDELRLR